MSRIVELRERMARIATNARAKLDEIKDDTPEDRAAEINREFDAMMADHDKLDEQVKREERAARAEALRDAPDPRRPNGGGSATGAAGGEAPSYRESFEEWLRNAGDQSAMRPEARSVLQAGYRSVPAEQRAQTTANAAGGYTIPQEWTNLIIRSMKAWGPMYDEDICTVLTTEGGNIIPLPTIDDTATTTSTTAEGVTLGDTGAKDVVVGQKQLEAYSRNTEWLRVSRELGQDSLFDWSQLLADLLGERLGRVANSDLTTGNGSSNPNGIVTAASLGKTAASATAFTWDEIMDTEHSVDPAYRASPKCRWMFHDNILLAARKLKDGQGNYLWQMGDVKGNVPPTFNGRPYSINQAMAGTQAAAAKIALFGDFSKYFVRKVGAPLIGAIQDKDFWPGFGVAGWIRFDGELADTAAVKYLRNA